MKARLDYAVPGPRVARVALDTSGFSHNRFVVFHQNTTDRDDALTALARAAYVRRWGEPRPGQRIVAIELLGAPA